MFRWTVPPFFIKKCVKNERFTSPDIHYLFLMQVFNNSPDETAYFRMMLNRENVANAVVMIQPSLVSYSFQSGPEPVLLDATAIASDSKDNHVDITADAIAIIEQAEGFSKLEKAKLILKLGQEDMFGTLLVNTTDVETRMELMHLQLA